MHKFHVGQTNRQQIVNVGFEDHITKPVEPAFLATAIASLIARTNGK
jgi:CheY-like chemotaxis protein